MTDSTSVAETLLGMFADIGVEAAFGLPGVHNLAFWRDQTPGATRIVGVRHEQTCVYAADGSARANGGLGVAITTTGPGAANAVAAFGEAAASGSPVLLVASDVSTAFSRRGVVRGLLHESRDQAAFFEPLAKAVYRPRTAVAAVAAVADAIELALSWPRGPVFVSVPTDVLGAPGQASPVTEPRRRVPSGRDVRAAADLINAAESIVAWAGGGVVQSGAEEALLRLALKVRAPILCTFGARGVVPNDHPCFVGLPVHEPEVERMLGAADLLVGVGSDFDGMDTKNWTMRRPERLISINCDATDISKNYPADVSIHGDARLALEMLDDVVSERERSFPPVGELRHDVWARLRSEPQSAAACRLVDLVDMVAGATEAVVVNDMCIPGYWMGGYSQITGSRRVQYPVGWGTLGYALPASIGAAVGSNRPVLALIGDGGLMFGVGELAVLAQENLPITVLLVDDGGYGMLRYDQMRSGQKERGVDLLGPDFVALASAFGLKATALDALDDRLSVALAQALEAEEPRMIVVREHLSPPRTTSPRWAE